MVFRHFRHFQRRILAIHSSVLRFIVLFLFIFIFLFTSFSERQRIDDTHTHTHKKKKSAFATPALSLSLRGWHATVSLAPEGTHDVLVLRKGTGAVALGGAVDRAQLCCQK